MRSLLTVLVFSLAISLIVSILVGTSSILFPNAIKLTEPLPFILILTILNFPLALAVIGYINYNIKKGLLHKFSVTLGLWSGVILGVITVIISFLIANYDSLTPEARYSHIMQLFLGYCIVASLVTTFFDTYKLPTRTGNGKGQLFAKKLVITGSYYFFLFFGAKVMHLLLSIYIMFQNWR